MCRHIFAVLVVVNAIYDPAVSINNSEQLKLWVQENSEIFVILKHWNKLPLIATAWKKLRDTPEVMHDRLTFTKTIETIFQQSETVTLPNIVSTTETTTTTSTTEDVTLPTTTEISEDTTSFLVVEGIAHSLSSRIDKLEEKLSQVNCVCQSPSKIVISHNGNDVDNNDEPKTVGRRT